MARKEITTPLDLNNMNNHNGNYDELYGLIDETDRRISEDMWEEIKDANTMKMLEPVQTATELTTKAADKSLITVIDEQRVYGFVHGEWQPFSEIDLDPFEPFKTELQTMIDDHEATAQQLLAEMQTEHDNAVTEITGLTSDFNTDYQAKMDAFASDYQTKSDQLLADYNSYSGQIDTNTTNSLSDIDTAKNSALTELENFQNTDTSNWQKFKLTEENGDRISKVNLDVLALESGFFDCSSVSGVPHDEASRWFIDVYQVSDQDAKLIKATLGYTGEAYQRTIYGSSDSGWKKLTGSTSELYDGNVSSVGTTFTLNDDPTKYTYLMVYGTNGDGEFIFPAAPNADGHFYVKDLSIYADAGGAIMYEIECQQGATPTDYTIVNSLFYRIHSDVAEESATAAITKIVGVN